MAICISQTQTLQCSAELVVATLLDHEHLDRFFNASFATLPAHTGIWRRQVKMLGYQFIEHVEHTEQYSIEYYIAGQSPVKNHHAKIHLTPLKSGCQLVYVINCDAKFWQPTWLLKALITQDLQRALIKLKAYCDAC
ncbi:MAG TPA: SRPBCC family protein [Pseudoalteromonas prydzensis]|uniref:SRPBCC family protein n=1 Tax=Pseudoalteromonas prydzensis TaxID=182141 RepID=A0A7V1GFT0_9GAMM|nr:SRPBCC family protein [Pseudoalteromonas prydzensis]HEA18008.1 SRPBCC family protein [Pseudoalteromonas prydzensis]